MKQIRVENTSEGTFVYEDTYLISGVIWDSKLLSSPLKEKKRKQLLQIVKTIMEGLIVITFIICAL